MHRFTLVVIVVAGAATFAGCTGCSTLPVPRVLNQPPTVRLTQAPIDSTSENFYSITLNWVGYDPDGRIEHYRYAIDPPEAADSETTWVLTRANEKRFTFSASTHPSGLAGEGKARDFHRFVIVAVDDDGDAGPRAHREFFTYTTAPTVGILEPRASSLTNRVLPPSLRITWAGQDVDGVFTSRPVRYRHRLFSASDALPVSFDSMLTNPSLLRDTYAPEFAIADGWVPSGSETTTVEFDNLKPNEQYVFVVVAFDEAGAYSPVFSLDNNMLRFRVGFGASRGPKICVFNEYFFYCMPSGGYPTPPAGERRIEVPEHQKVHFEWTADPAPGADVRCYRWMLDGDVFDRTGRTDEFTDVTRWSTCSRVVRVEVGPFDRDRDGPDHYLYVEAEDNLGLKSLVTVHMTVVRATLDRPLLVVNDTRLNPPRVLSTGCFDRPKGPWPTAAELDTFLFARGVEPWPCPYPPGVVPERGLFDGYPFEVERTRYGRRDMRLPLSVIGQYRHVVWLVDSDGARFGRVGNDLNAPTTSLRYMCASDQVNTLAAYVKQGGEVWLAGGGGAFASLIPNNDPANDLPRETFSHITGRPAFRELDAGRMMYDLAKWQSEISIAKAPSLPIRDLGRFRDRPGLYALLPESLEAKTPHTDPLPPLRNASDFYVSVFAFEFLKEDNVYREPTLTDPADFLIDAFDDADPAALARRWISSDSLNTVVSQDPSGTPGRAMRITTQGGGASTGDVVARTFAAPRDWAGLVSLRFSIRQDVAAAALRWRVRIVDARGASMAASVPPPVAPGAGGFHAVGLRLGAFITDSPRQPNLGAVTRLEFEPVTADAPGTTSIDQVAIAMTFEAPALDTLYAARGGGSTSLPPHNATMTYYHGNQSTPFVFTGFSLWMFRRAQCQQLIDFVMQRLWGLEKSGHTMARPARAATPERRAWSGEPDGGGQRRAPNAQVKRTPRAEP